MSYLACTSASDVWTRHGENKVLDKHDQMEIETIVGWEKVA